MNHAMNDQIIHAINSALFFSSGEKYEKPEMRPWQYVQMEYERVGMMPPVVTPDFESLEDAQIWMCLDAEYNTRLRERDWLQAV